MIIYRSFYEGIKDLAPNEAIKVWNAVFEYGLNEQEPELDGLPSIIFKLIKPQLDANLRKYENGQKGGRPKNLTETKAKPNHNLSETKQEPKHNLTESKTKANVNENVNDNYNENEKENVNASVFTPPSLDLILSEFPKFAEARKFHAFYTANGWQMGKNPMKDWRAAVKSWEARGLAEAPKESKPSYYKKGNLDPYER